MLERSEAVGEAAGLLDDEVDGLGAAVGDAVGLEPGQDGLAPQLQGAAEARDLRDGALGEGADDQLGDPLDLGRLRGLVHRAELLVGVPGEGDLPARVAGGEAGVELGDLLLGQVLPAPTQQPADLEQRIVLVPPGLGVPPMGEVSCWTRRLTSSTTCVQSFTT